MSENFSSIEKMASRFMSRVEEIKFKLATNQELTGGEERYLEENP